MRAVDEGRKANHMKERPRAFCTTCGYVLYDATQPTGECPTCYVLPKIAPGVFELAAIYRRRNGRFLVNQAI